METKGEHLSTRFLEKIEEQENILKGEERLFKSVGYIKLILIIILGVSLYYWITTPLNIVVKGIFITVLLTSIPLWIYHIKIKEKMTYSRGLILLYNKQLDRINGRWTEFEDLGFEFIDTEHHYSCDLDIVGKGSLFQFLNTTETWHGRQAFGKDLLLSKYSVFEIYRRQEAVKELSDKIDFSSKVLFYLSKIGFNPSTPTFIESLTDSTPFLKNTIVRIFLKVIPFITLVLIGMNIILSNDILLILLALFIGVQLLTWIIGFLKTPSYLKEMANVPYKLGTYTKVIELLIHEEFSSSELIKISEQLKNAEKGVKDLSKISSRISIKHNPLLYFFLNITLLWDYQLAFALEKWKKKYSTSSEKWFLAIGNFESLLSLSHLPQVCEGVSLPIFSEESRIIFAKDLGHPLLSNEKRVTNDFDFQENIVIISGSNMSGKTTFLRTVGINLVMAQAGGFVCAKEMKCSLLDVITSMRVADDLTEGVSTFYAELKKVKGIIDSANESNMLFLIDEIFRGTNSKDRLLGAKTVINKLCSLNAVGLISTHDLELCQLEGGHTKEPFETSMLQDSTSCNKKNITTYQLNKQEISHHPSISCNQKTVAIRNSHFSEYYEGGKIHFDYQLKEGVSTTSNARFLMKMVGIDTESMGEVPL